MLLSKKNERKNVAMLRFFATSQQKSRFFGFSATFPILRNFSDSPQLPQLFRFFAIYRTFNVFPENMHVLLSQYSALSLKYAVEEKKKNVAMLRFFAITRQKSRFFRFASTFPILRNFI